MADSHNQAEVKTKYPVTEGLIAGSTKQTGDRFLITRALKSYVTNRSKAGI